MTTDDSKAALAAALERHHDSEGFCVYCSSERVFEPWPCDAARAREEIARLTAALRQIAATPKAHKLVASICEIALGPKLDDIHGTPTFSDPT